MAILNIKQVKGATQGSILFLGHNGIITENNSKLYWDNNNYRLGIGTASPVARVDIFSTGTSSSDNALVIKDSNGSQLAQFRNDAYIQFGNNNKTTSVVLQSAANQTNVLRVLSSMNSEHFGIDSIYNDVGFRIGHNPGGGSFSVKVKDYWFYSYGDTKPTLSITGQASFNQTHVAFGTTASMKYKLHVYKERTLYNSDHYGQRIEIAGIATGSIPANLTTYGLDIQNNGTYSTSAVGFIFKNVGLNINVGKADINYGILVSGTAYNGFGTTTPNAMIHIESSSIDVPLLIASGSSTNDLVRITQVGNGNALVVEDSSNPDYSRFVVDSNGNVGIGTSSNTSNKLNVLGNVTVTGYLFAGSASNSYQFSWATASYDGLEGPNVLYVGTLPTTTYTYINTSNSLETYTILAGYFRGKNLSSVGDFATNSGVTHWLFEGNTGAGLTSSNTVHIRSQMNVNSGEFSRSNILLLEHSNTSVAAVGGSLLRGLGGVSTSGRISLFNFDVNGYNAFGTESDSVSAMRIIHPASFYTPGSIPNQQNTRGLFVSNPYSYTLFSLPGRIKYGIDVSVDGTFSSGTYSSDATAIGLNNAVSGGQINIGEQISVTATSSGIAIGLSVSTSGGANNIALSLNSGTFRYAHNASNGYVLVSDSNGFASWTASSNIITGGITGSGATNYLSRWVTSTQVGTSSIYDSGTAVGIATQSDSSYALNVYGDVNIMGTLYAVSKSFNIVHPLDPTKRLTYGSLEGPEYGVYFRGKLNGYVIELPDYWSALVDENSITVNLTPYDRYQNIFVERVENNKVYINTDNGNIPMCYYIVYGQRKDIPKIIVE